MKHNVDLTENSRFSSSTFDNVVWSDNLISDFFDIKSRFYSFLKIREWTSRCLTKPDKILRDLGIKLFHMNMKSRLPGMDICLTDRNTYCFCCGKTIVPWKEYCNKCLNANKSLEEYRYRWPYVKTDEMTSDTRILYI